MTPFHCLECRFNAVEPEPFGAVRYVCKLLLKTFRPCEMNKKAACREFRAQEPVRPA